MKKLLVLKIIAICSLFFNPCIAQFNVYHPFPHKNASWCQTDNWLDQSGTCSINPNTITSYYDYYVNGDTIVNSKPYFKLRTSGGYQIGSSCPDPIYEDYDGLRGLIREDTAAKKVYLSVAPNWGIDTLLYDFTLNQGDYYPTCYISASWDSTFIIAIDSILVGTSYRKQFILAQYKLHPYIFDSIIEGIGCMRGLLTFLIPPFEADSWLTGFRNGTVLFPAGDTCKRYFLSVENLEKPVADISVYPNPSNGKFNFKCTNPELVSRTQKILIYNVLGEKVYNATLNQVQGDNSINISAQPSGVYLYRVITESGELLGEGKLVIQK